VPTTPASPPSPARVRPPRAPLAPRIAGWLSALKPKPRPVVAKPARTPDATPADAKPEKRKASVKPIPSLRERAAKRAQALADAAVETTAAESLPVTPPVQAVEVVETMVATAPPIEIAETIVAPEPRIAPPQPSVVPASERPLPAPRTTPAPSFLRTRASATRLSMPARWPRIATIAALSLLLGVQLLLAQRVALANDARWRPAIGALCTALRCDVPAWHQPEAFTMVSRDVRPHPRAPGTLRIDASFRNDARWPQAWPLLVVSLSDIDGRIVGTRAFTAREYLGAAPTQNVLASGQMAAVGLDVVEPAPGIVAFGFEFR